jgi:hypothetical protein
MSQLWKLIHWFWFLLWALAAKLFAPRRSRVAPSEESDVATEEDPGESDKEEPSRAHRDDNHADTLHDLPPVPWHEAIGAPELADVAVIAGVNDRPST